MALDDRIPIGRRGEGLARGFLQRRGLEILASNVRAPFGELDLVARDGDTLVFVEVRSRRGSRFGRPEASLSSRKMGRIIRLAQWYIKRHGLYGQRVRFDVVGVTWEEGEATVKWIRGAFDAGEFT